MLYTSFHPANLRLARAVALLCRPIVIAMHSEFTRQYTLAVRRNFAESNCGFFVCVFVLDETPIIIYYTIHTIAFYIRC